MCDLVIGNAENLYILDLLLTLVIILKALWFLDLLFPNLQQLQNTFILQIGQLHHLNWIAPELLYRHELLTLLPGDLQGGREVLIQVPDVHVY